MESLTPFPPARRPGGGLPVDLHHEGLAMGMQIAGPARADRSVLALARAYEQASGCTRHAPPVLRRAT